MTLNVLLEQKNMSRYRLSKESGIAQATIADICSGKAHIEKCAADTLYHIAQVLGVTIEDLIKDSLEIREVPQRTSFDVFKSNVCHLVKDKGDIDFMIEMITTDKVRALYQQKWYAESFYLLAMIDYLSRENDIPLCTKYEDIRQQKLQKIIYPTSVVLKDAALKTDENKKESVQNAIPEFMKFNIVECEVRNVC